MLASWVPADAIDDAVEATGKQASGGGAGSCRRGLSAYLVMALALFAEEDYEEVAARLAGTFADWDGWEESWDRVPTSGGITQARQRLGPEPLKELFAQVARPVADMVTAGAFLGPVAADEHRRHGVGRAGHAGERGVLRLTREPGRTGRRERFPRPGW